jgi:hypothetical protein
MNRWTGAVKPMSRNIYPKFPCRAAYHENSARPADVPICLTIRATCAAAHSVALGKQGVGALTGDTGRGEDALYLQYVLNQNPAGFLCGHDILLMCCFLPPPRQSKGQLAGGVAASSVVRQCGEKGVV